MRNMSFAMTVKQIQDGTKTVTRRFGWWFLKSGDLVLPVRKSMGLRKGEKVQPLRGPIRIVATQAELLREISAEDCAREGFPTFSPSDFVRMMEKKYGPFSGLRTTNRIEFEYTD